MTIRGFKTIKALEAFEPRHLTALIGANGAGKSNFISFFRMLSWALSGPGNLPLHVGQQGGASALLHDGQETTREIEAELTLSNEDGDRNQYAFKLFYAANDTLVFAEEKYRFVRSGHPNPGNWVEAGAGHTSPRLLTQAASDQTAYVIGNILKKIIVHQFHNTSYTARMRSKWDVDDSRWLKEDAANIAPVLLRLRTDELLCYQRIVAVLRLLLPFFMDFDLEPRYNKVLLCWRERNSDRVFSVAQASDGMLRAIALVTLLLQPHEDLPDVLILDEPELGLHPYAINVTGELIRSVAQTVQVIVATQSTLLIDCFEPEEIVVVERHGRGSSFKRLEEEPLTEWLKEYSISELWEKNVVGGRP
ncbi:MAG: chromosome segregation protein SMC [Candidatus Synechococcus spongiarum SP3]|uniref:Chromosome segregation protein SMC n=1 Tax=Candidatus Synechococcus spongiarum SP3 TaxID=1604020 RepID=A0A0G2IW96_9SYNE|nr:MAG: chromosome segregation protein SMC [Candidatus Synechococcus spongiarum SP3]